MGRKAIVWIFQATNWQNLIQEDLNMAMKGQSLERNWISSNSSTKQCYEDHSYLSKKQNSKCRLCGDEDKTINHIISKCSKSVQKLVGMIGWEKWSTRNCARNWNLIILPYGICINKNPFKRFLEFWDTNG